MRGASRPPVGMAGTIAAFLMVLATLTSPRMASGADRPAGYPSQPVRLIVPFPPGGASDIVARAVAQRLSIGTGARFVVENRPGAGGSIGVGAVTAATPDGLTLLLGAAGPLSMSPHLVRLNYDVERDLEPIALVANVPNLVAIHPGVPATTLAELAELARRQPGQLTFGSAGQGTTAHLSIELFKSLARVEVVHVPYKGTSAAVGDLIGGQIQATIDNLTAILPQVRSGRLRAIALTANTRSRAAPTIPTAEESGMKDLVVVGWNGVLAPARTPQPIIDWLAQEVMAASSSADVRGQLVELGAEPDVRGPAAFSAYLHAELERWGRVTRAAGIRVGQD